MLVSFEELFINLSVLPEEMFTAGSVSFNALFRNARVMYKGK